MNFKAFKVLRGRGRRELYKFKVDILRYLKKASECPLTPRSSPLAAVWLGRAACRGAALVHAVFVTEAALWDVIVEWASVPRSSGVVR